MAPTIADVEKWNPDAFGATLTSVTDKKDELVTHLDAMKSQFGRLDWTGGASVAAGHRIDEEGAAAEKVSDAIAEVAQAMSDQSAALSAAKAAVAEIKTAALDQGFEVGPEGTVTANAKLAQLDRADPDGSNGAAVQARVRIQQQAADFTKRLGEALLAAEAAATSATDKVNIAIDHLDRATDALGDPNAAAGPHATGPASVTPVSHAITGAHSPGTGSGSGSHHVYSGAANTPHVSGGLGSSGGPTGPMPSGDKAKWIEEALRVLEANGVDTSTIDPRDLEAMIEHESGGDPHAINLWDSNAAAGTPSKGIMQCIDSTFEAYKVPGHDDIWNPVDNIVAAVRYSNDRYGGIDNVPGIEGLRSGSGYVGY